MSRQSQTFAKLLPEGGTVLDAGCGSGRDTRALRALGLQVSSMDASAALAREAEAFLGTPVEVLRHQEMEAVDTYDGIWAMATLLHVPRSELGDVFRRYARALHEGGIMLASFKVGDADGADSMGRWFTKFTQETLLTFLAQEAPSLSVLRLSESADASRPDTQWLEVTLIAQPL